MDTKRRDAGVLIAAFAVSMCLPSNACAIKAIQQAITSLEKVAKEDPNANQELESLQLTIADGKKTIEDLRAEGGRLEREKALLEQQKRSSLERMMT